VDGDGELLSVVLIVGLPDALSDHDCVSEPLKLRLGLVLVLALALNVVLALHVTERLGVALCVPEAVGDIDGDGLTELLSLRLEEPD
jgi:hypothetical protein